MARTRSRRQQLWLLDSQADHAERFHHPLAAYQQRHHHRSAANLPGMVWLPWLLTVALTGPQSPVRGLQEVYRWRQVDLEYPSQAARDLALASGDLVPDNMLPLGLEVWRDRVFLTLPRWKPGVPVTLATVPRDATGEAPLLRPYPSWDWHDARAGCRGLTSVFRVAADTCGRLWVLDSGLADAASDVPSQRCPPELLIFDMRTDQLLWRYQLPTDQAKDGSLFSNVAVDVRGERCADAHAYLADVWRFGLVVYRLRDNRSWRVDHHTFFPEPPSCRYDLHGVTFRWTDGVFGLSLSPETGADDDRLLYYHAMSGTRQYAVPTSVLRNETSANGSPDSFVQVGEPRYVTKGQASAAAVDRRGVMFYNLVSRDAVGCWNTAQPGGFARRLQGVVANDSEALWFPNDLKVDQDARQSVWVLSNRLPSYIYASLDPRDYNFRVLRGFADELVEGTVCDPRYEYVPRTEDVATRVACPA